MSQAHSPRPADGRHAQTGDDTTEITVSAWIGLVESGSHRAWSAIDEAAKSAIESLGAACPLHERDPLRSDVVVMTANVPASWRRKSVADVPLLAWIRGVVRRTLDGRSRERSRQPASRQPLVEAAAADSDDFDPDPDPGEPRVSAGSPTDAPPPVPGDDAEAKMALMTPAQQDVCRHLLAGKTVREIAELVGITPAGVRDRARRGAARVRRGTPPPRAQGWEAECVATRSRRGGWSYPGGGAHAALLIYRDMGWTYERCARELRMTTAAAKSAVARIWRKWRDECSPHRDTPLTPGP